MTPAVEELHEEMQYGKLPFDCYALVSLYGYFNIRHTAHRDSIDELELLGAYGR